MDIPDLLGLKTPSSRGRLRTDRQSAFTLVEVTLAIGIVAFAFVAVFGLIPTGMTAFRRAMDVSIGSQIAERVINDAQQTDYPDLIKNSSGAAIAILPAGNTGVKAERYFDEQGDELSAGQAANAVYTVNTRIMPATSLPATSSAAPSPSPTPNQNIATVTVQVAHNPGSQALSLSASNLWTGAYNSSPAITGAVPITTYSAMVARSE